jgi:hypothetical protein
LFEQLSKKGLHSFRSSFVEEEYKVTMYHFVGHNCYVVRNGGNHRTTWAKVLNAPFIAAEATRCRAIPEKYGSGARNQLVRLTNSTALTNCSSSVGQRYFCNTCENI